MLAAPVELALHLGLAPWSRPWAAARPLDPYLCWFWRAHRMPARRGPRALVQVLIERDKDRADEIDADLGKAGFVARANPAPEGHPKVPPKQFVQGWVPLEKLPLLQGWDSLRIELSNPRVRSTTLSDASLQLLSLVQRELVDDSARQLVQNEVSQSPAFRVQVQTIGLSRLALQWLKFPGQEEPDSVEPSAPPCSRQEAIVRVLVVDDQCNLSAAPVLALLRSLWDQDAEAMNRLRARLGSTEGQAGAWQVFGVEAERPPAPSSSQQGSRGTQCVPAPELLVERSGAGLDEAALRSLQSGDELRAYRETAYADPPLRWSHGSAVLHLLTATARPCGPRAGNPDRALDGALPDELHFVQLPQRTVLDTSGGSLASQALAAIERAVRLSHTDEGARVIVNMSYGTHSGPHDGTSMFERALVELLDRNAGRVYSGRDATHREPELHVVLPAGNAHLHRCHAMGYLAEGGARTLLWRVLPDDGTDSFCEIWFDEAGAGCEITVTPPGDGPACTVCRGKAIEWRDDGDRLVAMLLWPFVPTQGLRGSMALLALSPTMRLADAAATLRGKRVSSQDEATLLRVQSRAPAGTWTVLLRNTAPLTARFDAWIQRDDAAPGGRRRPGVYQGRQSYFVDCPEVPDEGDVVDPRSTLSGIATAVHQRLHVVGAMDDSLRPSVYSAAGPDRDVGMRMAPNVLINADISRNQPGRLTGGMLTGARMRVSGTSIAAAAYSRMLVHSLTHNAAGHRTDWVAVSDNSLTSRPVIAGERATAPPYLQGIERISDLGDIVVPATAVRR